MQAITNTVAAERIARATELVAEAAALIRDAMRCEDSVIAYEARQVSHAIFSDQGDREWGDAPTRLDRLALLARARI